MTRGVLTDFDMKASASLGLSPDADINSEDNETVARGEELLDLALTATAQLGGEYLVGVIYSALKKYPGPCSAAARKNVVAALKVPPPLLCCSQDVPALASFTELPAP